MSSRSTTINQRPQVGTSQDAKPEQSYDSLSMPKLEGSAAQVRKQLASASAGSSSGPADFYGQAARGGVSYNDMKNLQHAAKSGLGGLHIDPLAREGLRLQGQLAQLDPETQHALEQYERDQAGTQTPPGQHESKKKKS